MGAASSFRQRAFALWLAAVAGAAVLGLEVLVARAMAPVLGGGAAVWAAMLSVALGSLACGNLLGGWLAGRDGRGRAIPWAMIFCAAGLIVLSQTYRPVMQWAGGKSLTAGAIAGAAAIQFLPMLLLGTVSPALLRMGGQGKSAALWAGAVLACGSAGGIAGALLVALVCLPAFGIARSFLTLAGALLASVLPACLGRRRLIEAAALLAGLLVAAVLWGRSAPGNVVQSAYGQLEVLSTPQGQVLLIDGMPQTGMPADVRKWQGLGSGHLLELPLAMGLRPRQALVIGLGGGLCPRVLAAHQIECETVELDPAVLAAARDCFGFQGQATIADGRAFLKAAERRWDLIVLDVCTSDALAWHLFTVEAMRLVRSRLSPGGVLAIQFIGDDGPWSASLKRTVDHVFGATAMLGTTWPGVGPRWIFAGLPPGAMAAAGAFDPDHLPWRQVQATPGGTLLTDDRFGAELWWAAAAADWRYRFALGR